jgi:hypothetical protein
MKSQRRRVRPSPRYESAIKVDNGTCTQIKKDYRILRSKLTRLYRGHLKLFNPAKNVALFFLLSFF